MRHSQIKWQSGAVIECDGEMEEIGQQGQLLELQCSECRDVVFVPKPPDLSWQERADMR